MTIEIPNGPTVNFVIGRSGASIKEMQSKTGCHIGIQKETEVMPGATKRQVTITGETDVQVNYCASLVQSRVNEYHATVTSGPSNSMPPPTAAASGYPPPGYPPAYPSPYGYPPADPCADKDDAPMIVRGGDRFNQLLRIS